MPDGILGLELVNNKLIRYTYVRKKQKGGILSKIGEFPLSDFSKKDPAELSNAVKEIISKEALSPKQICLAISGEEPLIHQINLPKMKEAELNEVVLNEIERIPRFADKKFDYIYTGTKLDEHRLRLLTCALTKESLNYYIQGIRQTGILLKSLEISPLNILELLFYTRTDKNKVEALLVLEERSSHITIFSQNEYKLFFQLALGKLDLYTPDYELDKARYSNWIEEINRMFKSYQREFRTSTIERVWIIWDNENIKDLDKLLAKDLETEVVIPKTEDFAIKLEKEIEFNPIYFPALAGVINYIKDIKQKLNFRHFLRQIELKNTVKMTRIFVLIYILCAGVLLGGLTAHYISGTKEILTDENQVAQRIESLNAQTAELRKERNEHLNTKNKLLMQAAYVRMLNRISWSEIFARIGAILPENARLSSFEVMENGQIKLEGATFAIDTVAELIRKINEVPFLEDAQFNFLREKEVEKKRIVEFGIITKLKGNLNAEK